MPKDRTENSTAPRRVTRLVRAIRRHPLRVIAVSFLFMFLGLNALAFMHAWGMTHFVPEGIRPRGPENSTLLQKANLIFTGVEIPRPRNLTTPTDHGMEFETRTLPTSDGETLEMWYVPEAEPKGLVLLFHGYAAAKSACLEEAARFSRMGYSVLLTDFRGSGGSTGNKTSIGFHEALDVDAAVEYGRSLHPELPVYLYAKSMGSATILRACSVLKTCPDAIILESPFDRLLTTVGNRFALMGLPKFPAAHLLVFWGGVQNGFNGFAHNPVDYAQNVQIPCLLLAGEEDTRVGLEEARGIYIALPGVKRLSVFTKAGHVSLLSEDALKWEDDIRSFLSSLEKPASATPGTAWRAASQDVRNRGSDL